MDLITAKKNILKARSNLEQIVNNLQKSGYRFAYPDYMYLPPQKDIRDQIHQLETIIGPLPVFIKLAFEFLGSFNLIGDHPEWPKTGNIKLRSVEKEEDVWFTDPFVFASIDLILDDTEGWDGKENFALSFSGDSMTKAGYSGGLYSVMMPSKEDDPYIAGNEENLSFMEYLHLSLFYGGFAGFKKIPERPQDFINNIIKTF